MAIIESTGLQEVQDAQRNELCTVDIILVDWLESCWKCWCQNCDHNWLAEELPKSHPGARFLVFRDQARVAQTFEHESISPGTIRSTARELLSECERLQPDVTFQQCKDSSSNAQFANSRPLIFICRGLGGLVVKEALLVAAKHDWNGSTARRTCGIVFLGTPHAGDVQDWENKFQTSLEPLAGRISNKALSKRSEIFEAFSTISSAFGSISTRYKIVSFCQENSSECSDASVLHNDCLWNIISCSPMPNSKREHYTVPPFCPIPTIKARVEATIECMIKTTWTRNNGLCDSVEHQRALLRRFSEDRLFNTCTWILKHEQYKRWLTTDGATCLWIHGIPGAGKSVLSSAIVDNLRSTRRSKPVIITCFVDEFMEINAYARYMLHTIISQLELHQQIKLSTQLTQSILVDLETSAFQMTPTSFRYQLQRIFAGLETEDRIIFIVDGADAEEWINTLIIHEIVQANASRCKTGLFKCSISSRASISASVPQNQVAGIELSKELGLQRDLKAFAEDRLSRLTQRSCKEGSSPMIVRRLCSLAEANFLWISMVLGALVGLHSQPASFNDFLDSLPSGLNGIYDRILQSIHGKHFVVANKVFSWVLAARRPLRLSELIEAINVGERGSTFKGLLHSPQELRTICGSLVIVAKDNIVRFVHSSARDYFLSKHEAMPPWNSLPKAHELIANACLTVLTSSQSETENLSIPYTHVEAAYVCLNGPLPNLLEYAAANWKLHYGLAEATSPLLPGRLQRFLSVTLNRICQKLSMGICGRSTRIAQTILRLCSRYGFSNIVQLYLEMGVPPDCNTCTYCDPPIHLAAAEGHTEIVALLLQKTVGIETRTFADGRTPLHSATAARSLDTVRLLLEHGAKADAVTSDIALTSLHVAARTGHFEAVELLITYGADVNAKLKTTNETPLHFAVAHGHVEVVKCLVDGSDASAKALELYEKIVQQSYYKAWSDDILSGHCKSNRFVWEIGTRSLAETDMEELSSWLPTCVDISIRDIKGRTSLHLAAFHGHEAIVRLLLESGASHEAQDNEGLTALQLAVAYGHSMVVKVLMMAGANPDIDMKGWSAALEQAADRGHAPVANLIIWQTFRKELDGMRTPWPQLHLAMKGKHNVIQSALSRKRAQSWKSRRGSATRLSIRRKDR